MKDITAISAHEGVSIGGYFWLIVGRKCAGSVLKLHPSLFLLANLTLITLANETYYMPTFVGSHFLPLNFLSADPAAILFLFLPYQEGPKFFQSKLVLSSRAVNNFDLFFCLINVDWSILKGPESCFNVLLFLRVELIDTSGLNILSSHRLWLIVFLSGCLTD